MLLLPVQIRLEIECICISVARLAQLVERKALNLVVVGSSPTVGTFYVSAREKWTTKSGRKNLQRQLIKDGGHGSPE